MTYNSPKTGHNIERTQTPAEQVRLLYSQLALHPQQDFGWMKGMENAKRLGYAPEMLTQIPNQVWESSAAVGNPFALGPIHAGETLVDLGCGAGADLCVAALKVGKTGRVIGIDLTPEMVRKAQDNVALINLTNAEVMLGDFVNLPLQDNSANVVISNGAINLSPKQACVFREIYRVLRPAGRLYLADMIRLDTQSTPTCESLATPDSWANCIGGTLSKDCLQKLIIDAGFQNVEFVQRTGYHTSPETEGALFRATKS